MCVHLMAPHSLTFQYPQDTHRSRQRRGENRRGETSVGEVERRRGEARRQGQKKNTKSDKGEGK